MCWGLPSLLAGVTPSPPGLWGDPGVWHRDRKHPVTLRPRCSPLSLWMDGAMRSPRWAPRSQSLGNSQLRNEWTPLFPRGVHLSLPSRPLWTRESQPGSSGGPPGPLGTGPGGPCWWRGHHPILPGSGVSVRGPGAPWSKPPTGSGQNPTAGLAPPRMVQGVPVPVFSAHMPEDLTPGF